MSNVTIMNHPLIKHKISMLRNENTGTNEFRTLVEEIAMLMGYEALRDLPTEDVESKRLDTSGSTETRRHTSRMSITVNCRIRSSREQSLLLIQC